MNIYCLSVYLKDDNQLFLIDRTHSEDLEELQQLAKERKTNNPEYFTIIRIFKLNDAIIA